VNRLHQLLAGLGIAAIALAACGGGGGGSVAPKTVTQAKARGLPAQANKATPLPAAASFTQVGTARVALTLPHVLTGKNAQAVRAIHGMRTGSTSILRKPSAALLSKIASTTRRSPKYVDPIGCQYGSCPPNLIDIYVDGVLVPNLDGCAGPLDSICVNSMNDGTQNLSIPLYSTNSNDIVVEEFDPCGSDCGDLLAMGNTFVGSFQPGTAVNASVTMQMNTAYVGILDVYNQQDPEVMTGQTYYGLSGTCGESPQKTQFGLYTADSLGDFVPVAGYGGTSTPTETATSDNGGTTLTPQTTIPGLWFVSWDGNCDGVAVNATATNPAYAISYDVLGPYPQDIDGEGPYYSWCNADGCWDSFGGPFYVDPQNGSIDGSYGYANCAWDGYLCNGGPYQAAWNQVWYYHNNSEWAFYLLYCDLYPQVITGSVDIQDAPSPNPSGTPNPCGSDGC
jgi:hypothetical protein